SGVTVSAPTTVASKHVRRRAARTSNAARLARGPDVVPAADAGAVSVTGPSGIDTPVADAPTDGQTYYPQALWDATASQYFVTWVENRFGPYELFGARIQPGGNIVDKLGLPLHSFSIVPTGGASMAQIGSSYLVVYGDKSSGTNHVFGVLVTSGGVV